MLKNFPLIESDEVFEQKMERGYADALAGRAKPLDVVFEDLRKRFSDAKNVVNRITTYDDLCADNDVEIYDKLKEAEQDAEYTSKRYSSEEVLNELGIYYGQ